MRTPLLLCFCLALSGCASKTYYNYNIDQSLTKKQYDIDNAQCRSYANGVAPAPRIRTYSNPYTNYNFNVTTLEDGELKTYHGSVYSQPSAADSLAQGVEIGNSIGASIARSNARHSCLLTLGWTTDKTEYEREIAKLPVIPQFEKELYNSPYYKDISRDNRQWWCAKAINLMWYEIDKLGEGELPSYEWRMEYIWAASLSACEKGEDIFEIMELTNSNIRNLQATLKGTKILSH